MRRSVGRVVVVATMAGLTATLAPPPPASAAPEPLSPLRGTINVSAAASLAQPFTLLALLFRSVAPGVAVNLNFAGSQALVSQVEQGAPVDVIATADEASLRRLGNADLLASDAFVFSRNELTMLVGRGNPRDIRALEDLGRPDVSLSLCAAAVPCGKYAGQILGDEEVRVTPKSLEDNVKGVVTKVRLGEVDAGITYVTDALDAASTTDLVRIPTESNVITAYPVAVPSTVRNDVAARVFVLFLLSPYVQDVLALFGFRRA